MSSIRPIGNDKWGAPSIKASLNPGVGLQDMANIVKGRPRTGDDPLTKPHPTAPKAPPPPIVEDTAGMQQDYADALRRRRGRAAAVLTGGNSGAPMTAAKLLLGS